MTRRTLLKTGLVGGALLATAGYISKGTFWGKTSRLAFRENWRYRFLTERDHRILSAIVPVVLAGALPKADDSATVEEIVAGFDLGVSGLPLAVQAEVRQLMTLLSLAPTRIGFAGLWPDWGQATPKQIDGFLRGWRFHRFALMRSAYDALRQLTLAAWYGNPKSWPTIGYNGPPKIA